MYVLLFKKNDGFSLIEAMAALVVLSLALFPALGYFSNSTKFVHQTEIRSQAMDIATDTMEYFKKEAKTNWSGIDSTIGNFSITNLKNLDNINKYYNDKLFVDYNINVNTSTVLGDLRKINIKVSWNSGKASVELNSLLRGGS